MTALVTHQTASSKFYYNVSVSHSSDQNTRPVASSGRLGVDYAGILDEVEQLVDSNEDLSEISNENLNENSYEDSNGDLMFEEEIEVEKDEVVSAEDTEESDSPVNLGFGNTREEASFQCSCGQLESSPSCIASGTLEVLEREALHLASFQGIKEELKFILQRCKVRPWLVAIQ